MNNLRNFLVLTFIVFFGLLNLQDANAQFTPQRQQFKGVDVKKTIKAPIRIIGKDLVISNAEMVPVGAARNGRVNYQVNFTVKNLGSISVEKETKVLINLVRYPLNNNNGTVLSGFMANRAGGNFDNLTIHPINGSTARNYVGYVPNGLQVGYRYQLEIKVDGCLGARDADPCRVQEVNENNNHRRLPEVAVR